MRVVTLFDSWIMCKELLNYSVVDLSCLLHLVRSTGNDKAKGK